jgi:HEAT repeat protein
MSLLLEDPAQYDQLLDALRHSDPAVRGAAANTLGRLGDTRAVEPLIDIFRDPVRQVGQRAAEALGRLGAPALGSVLAVIQETDSERERALAQIAVEAVRDSSAVPLLTAALTYDEPEARRGAARALGHIGGEEAAQGLEQATRHDDTQTRRLAGQALGRLASPNAIQALTAMLNEDDWQIRETAVEGLGRVGSRSVLIPILSVLADPVWRVRYSAVKAIQKQRTARSVATLLSAVDDAPVWARYHILETLGEIGDPSVLELLETTMDSEGDLQQRLSAAQALAAMEHPRGKALILRTLNAPNAQTRALAAIALGFTGDVRAVEHLIKVDTITGPAPDTPEGAYRRERVQQALVRIGTEAIPELILAVQSRAPIVRQTAGDALVEIGDPAVPALVQTLPTAPRATQAALVDILGRIGSPAGAGPSLAMLSGAVARPTFVRLLIAAISDPVILLRRRAAASLARMQSSEHGITLLESSRFDVDEEVRAHAQDSLVRMGDLQATLRMAAPNVTGFVYWFLVSLTYLALVTIGVGALIAAAATGSAAPLAGLLVGAVFGSVDGFAARKLAIRGLLFGGLFAGIFGLLASQVPLGSGPELLYPLSFLLSSMALGGSVGAWLGAQLGRPMDPQTGKIYAEEAPYPIGTVLLSLVGIAAGAAVGVLLSGAFAGALTPVIGTAVSAAVLAALVFRSIRAQGFSDSGGFRILLLLTPIVPLAGLLAFTVPGWGLPAAIVLLPVLGLAAAWRPLPLLRALAGLFLGTILGFVFAAIGILLAGLG